MVLSASLFDNEILTCTIDCHRNRHSNIDNIGLDVVSSLHAKFIFTVLCCNVSSNPLAK